MSEVSIQSIEYEIEMLNLMTGLTYDYSKNQQGYKLTNKSGGIDMSNYRMTKRDFYRALMMLTKTLSFALDQRDSKLFNFKET